MKIYAITVLVTTPDHARIKDVRDYVDEAVHGWRGQFHDEDIEHEYAFQASPATLYKEVIVP